MDKTNGHQVGESTIVGYEKRPLVIGITIATLLLIISSYQGGELQRPNADGRSLEVPGFLADGSEFETWEPEEFSFAKTLYVDQSHPNASDDNPGTKELPFKTINAAAQIVQPGERVIVMEGVYREWVRPARGGSDRAHIISYEAALGARVVIKGSELLKTEWMASMPQVKGLISQPDTNAKVQKIWMAQISRELFDGYNPFAMPNYGQADEITYWDLSSLFTRWNLANRPLGEILMQVRGLIFQDGKRLKQVSRYQDLLTTEGAFWSGPDGLEIHVTLYDGKDPNEAEWEITTREQFFAAEEYYLDYIRVKGFVMEHAGNSFPFPQRGAISAMHGNYWIIEDNEIRWVNGVAIDIGLSGGLYVEKGEVRGHIIRRNTITDCGIGGIQGGGQRYTLIEDNEFRRNSWHDVEFLAEVAAIKLHWSRNVLVRRNIVIDTFYGTGIYIDSGNMNCRITQNVVANSGSMHGPGPGIGGVYIEASNHLNMIDNNFIWNSTRTNGIYCFHINNVIIAHNMIGNNAGAGIMLLDMPTTESGRANTGGNNTVLNNVFVNNGWDIDFHQGKNESNYNLYATPSGESNLILIRETNQLLELGQWQKTYSRDVNSRSSPIRAEFDSGTLELVWSVEGDVFEVPVVQNIESDFWSVSRQQVTTPGPFGSVPTSPQRIVVDPRLD